MKKKRMPRHTSWWRIRQGLRRLNPTGPMYINRTKSRYNQHAKNKHGLFNSVSSTPEPGTFPAIPVQECRDGPVEDIAVHDVRITRVIEKKQLKMDSKRTTSGSRIEFCARPGNPH